MALHTAKIEGVQVPGYRYVVFGRQRGYVSTHRTKLAANRALAEDSRKCLRAGNPSDALVYRWRDGWVPEGRQEVDVELVTPPGSGTRGRRS
jgi:hypothetical protein